MPKLQVPKDYDEELAKLKAELAEVKSQMKQLQLQSGTSMVGAASR